MPPRRNTKPPTTATPTPTPSLPPNHLPTHAPDPPLPPTLQPHTSTHTHAPQLAHTVVSSDGSLSDPDPAPLAVGEDPGSDPDISSPSSSSGLSSDAEDEHGTERTVKAGLVTQLGDETDPDLSLNSSADDRPSNPSNPSNPSKGLKAKGAQGNTGEKGKKRKGTRRGERRKRRRGSEGSLSFESDQYDSDLALPMADSTGETFKAGEEQRAAAAAAGAGQGQGQGEVVMDGEEAGKVRDLMTLLDRWDPLLPEDVVGHYLARAGLDTQDVRVKRLFALAAQKFVSDIATDAFAHARIRGTASAGRRPPKHKGRTTLTMPDLQMALAEQGVHSQKPDYYL